MAELPKLWLTTDKGVGELTTHPGDPARCRLATAGDLTAALVADYLDRKAQGSNRHDFVGLHRYLARLIADKAGVGGARAVMLELLRKGGLHRVGE